MFARLEQMSTTEPAYEPFTGPLSDRKGTVVYEEGQVATIPELLGLQWAAANVVGPWPEEP